MASLTLKCPHCQGDIVLPATVVHSNGETAQVVVSVDQSVGEAHLRECRANLNGAPAAVGSTAPTSKELAGRIHQMLDMRAYVATGGSRACLMCGTNGRDCLEQMSAGEPGKAAGVPCCAACGNGDTHPAPLGTLGCAEWGAEHGAKS